MGDRDWQLGQWDEHIGYDCMTGGVRVGPVFLDGADYGQRRCQPIQPADKARLLEDARLIAAAPDMFEALRNAAGLLDTPLARRRHLGDEFYADVVASIRLAIEKAAPSASPGSNLADANPTSPLHGESGR